ncbi:hypothetical protein [Terrisporobacter sp.]|uniref:hypothetical protein n=1 Tax=Terrisporobacter sp. TaxID=1965305 RepID=UPI0025F970BC|nr:hypothetical protein [uncultured Terrisporobacter sp.]
MKKFSKIIGIFILMSIFLVGCNSNLDKKSTSLKEVNISSIKDNNYFTTTPKEELENKAFLVENSSDQYIVFYKMNIDKENVSCDVKNSILQINVKTSGNAENTYAYKIINSKEKNYESINLIKDGEEVAFSSVINVD